MADNHTPLQRSFNMSRIRGTDTKPEEMVRKYLFSKGLRYRKNDTRLPGKPDIVLPKYRAVVFVHGCFWHLHENCPYAVMPSSNTEYWSAKLTKNKKGDSHVQQQLTKLGWRVFVIWECQLKKDRRDRELDLLYKGINIGF